MTGDVLIYVENDGETGGLKRSAAEVASAGRRLADEGGGSLVALACGGSAEKDRDLLARHGVDRILHGEGDAFARYQLGPVADAVKAAWEQVQPKAFLLAASVAGKELGPTVAARQGAAFVSDVTALGGSDGGFRVTKPRFAGKAFATMSLPAPAVISIRPNSLPPEEAPRDGSLEPLSVTTDGRAARVTDVEAPAQKELELTEADVVVSGGRGLGAPENWTLILDLAEALGGAHGASRAVVDAGWRPHSEQVGQTGKTVTPKIYVAAGISGAIQHLAGMSSSKVIIAVNKDPEAPIFKVADYGIVGDVAQVLPLLTQAARSFLGG